MLWEITCFQQVASMLKHGICSGDVVCRYGGEEFLVVLLGRAHAAALKWAERVRTSVAEGSILPTPVTVSLGVATPQEGDTVESTIQRADQALYQAKQAGRNRVWSSNDNGATTPA